MVFLGGTARSLPTLWHQLEKRLSATFSTLERTSDVDFYGLRCDSGIQEITGFVWVAVSF